MEQHDIRQFMEAWRKHFPGVELPLAYWYADEAGDIPVVKPAKGHRCLVCDLQQARQGQSLAMEAGSITCNGGKRYLGFSQELHPQFEYFLSCGIPGRLEGERYKKSPEIVAEMLKAQPPFSAPGKYVIFARLDHVKAGVTPSVVLFFATCDLLSGLFTLANYDRADAHGVIAPMSSGCGSIVYYPFHELSREDPRAVLGMFDVSARPCVPGSELTLAVPWPLFVRMIRDTEESFLITPSWSKVRDRIQSHIECELK